MRLLSLKNATLCDNVEVFRPDSVAHSVYLHSRYWGYSDPFQQRAQIMSFGYRDSLYIDIGFFGRDSYVFNQTSQLGEATKVAMFICDDQLELAALTSDDEVVQILTRGDLLNQKLEEFEHVVLNTRRVDHWYRAWKDWLPRSADEWDFDAAVRLFGSDSFKLRFELDDRYAGAPTLPVRVLETGEGQLCDMRTNWSMTLSIVQLFSAPDSAEPIGSQIFQHPMGPSFLPSLNRKATEYFKSDAGSPSLATHEIVRRPSRKRKRRRRRAPSRPGSKKQRR